MGRRRPFHLTQLVDTKRLCYLNLIIDDELKWTEHIDHIYQ